jgi:hypothetical protein
VRVDFAEAAQSFAEAAQSFADGNNDMKHAMQELGYNATMTAKALHSFRLPDETPDDCILERDDMIEISEKQPEVDREIDTWVGVWRVMEIHGDYIVTIQRFNDGLKKVIDYSLSWPQWTYLGEVSRE